ncbi:hypothetical protein C7C45_28635 [Micromonospora arborensis]|uniref:Uncharacterized protein n=2 Tax=Micromonospora arborensis TaxID=2116518 RepID=A0A318NBT2_9ACTN|nr:hypothetical protein C7C45_28635 [Micromonospora arborensis]
MGAVGAALAIVLALPTGAAVAAPAPTVGAVDPLRKVDPYVLGAARATSGEVQPGAKDALTITVDTTGLAPGTYVATLLVTNNGAKGASTPITVSVTVTK